MDTKAANRIAVPRNEGIYRVASSLTAKLRCTICGRVLSSAVFPRSAHAKKHVREGKAVARVEYSYDGPRTIYDPSPSMIAEWKRSPYVSGQEAQRATGDPMEDFVMRRGPFA